MTTTTTELDVIARAYVMVSGADHEMKGEELERAAAFLTTHFPQDPEHVAGGLARAVAWYQSLIDDASRLADLERATAGLDWVLGAEARNTILLELIRIASSDGRAEVAEGTIVRGLRALFVRAAS